MEMKKLNVSMLPEHMQPAVEGYYYNGQYPGSFLRAVLSNQLLQSFEAADEINEAHMKDWVMFLYNELPSSAWGSSEKVDLWILARAHEHKNVN